MSYRDTIRQKQARSTFKDLFRSAILDPVTPGDLDDVGITDPAARTAALRAARAIHGLANQDRQAALRQVHEMADAFGAEYAGTLDPSPLDPRALADAAVPRGFAVANPTVRR